MSAITMGLAFSLGSKLASWITFHITYARPTVLTMCSSGSSMCVAEGLRCWDVWKKGEKWLSSALGRVNVLRGLYVEMVGGLVFGWQALPIVMVTCGPEIRLSAWFLVYVSGPDLKR
jgi:hypothetical protein